MIYLSDISQFHHDASTVVTIGKFDGLHRGHQALMKRTIDLTHKANDSRTAAVAVILDTAEKGLLTKSERAGMIGDEGFDYLLELPLSEDIRSLTAAAFVEDILIKRLKAESVVIGRDFRFGHGRHGDAAFLTAWGHDRGFSVEAVPDVTDDGIRISSTLIRRCLSDGQIERVNRYLGYRFSFTGPVIHGTHIGRTIDVPTANIVASDDKLLPPRGVYVSLSTAGGKTYRGMTNIGVKPTVNGSQLGIETHIFDFSGDLYGQEMKVELLHFARPESDFSSLDILKERLRKDKAETIEWFDKNGGF